MDHIGASIHDQEEIANLFNEYFSEIGEKLSSEIPSTNIKYADYIKTTNVHLNLLKFLRMKF